MGTVAVTRYLTLFVLPQVALSFLDHVAPANSGVGPTCFSCARVFHPAVCLEVEKCGAGEACVTIYGTTNTGGSDYTSGCMAIENCPKTVRSRDYHSYRAEQCVECCHDDLCNARLCKAPDILSGKLVCGNCIGINDPTKCGDVTICEAGEICSISRQTVTFDMGCKRKADCTGNTLARNGIQCCDSNLCNTNLASPPEAPYFLPSVKHIHLTDYPGTTAALKCNPHGFPTPDVVWLLPPGVQGEMVNGTLLLRNITANNTGIYTCTASNSAGEANFTLVMDVKEHDPVVATMKFPETDVTSANGVLLIQCEVDGDPKPDVTWSRVGASLSANARIQGNDLLIFPPSDLDVGLYVCNATNSNRETDTAYFALYKSSGPLTCDSTFYSLTAAQGQVFKGTCASNCGGSVTPHTFPTVSKICESAIAAGEISDTGGDVMWIFRDNGQVTFIGEGGGQLVYTP